MLRPLTFTIILLSVAAVPATVAAQDAPPPRSSSAVRIAMQGRLDVVNVFLAGDDEMAGNVVPFITPGVRLLDSRLFVGLGFGFFNVEDGNGGWSLSPLASFDLVRDDDLGALYLQGWLNAGSYNSPGGTDMFAWGLNAAVGIRALLTPGLAIGGEWGWGFISFNVDPPGMASETIFAHAMSGMLLFEASLGL